ncbi:HdeD family acid-resistance protein [Mucilaginibacter jinjuensis]|uniref:DUF308 domain-containing protein n=1 Tax=Mucilaginibacter jinjuensis TaxID=1176721 RepID=A0ABY7TAC4_9SPHI|nr:DUF308 domain-containing protein [Mucilaginibacter jinjuensis]WCT13174.1 DUF308 domain-containing protein [Mucilaginibacter jinjuensis]
MANLISALERSTRNWWLLLIAGIIFVLAGLVTLMYPISTYITFAMFFGIAILIGGILKISFAISNRESLTGWGWNLVSGFVSFMIGIMLINSPEISLLSLPFIIGFYILYAGGMLISVGIDERHLHVNGSGMVVAGGIVTLLLGIGILFRPAFAATLLISFIGISFIAEGITYCFFSFKINSARHHLHELNS